MKNYDEFTHKMGKDMSITIFNSEKEEKGIFFALAKTGPQILTDLGKITNNYGEWEIDRGTVKRKIKGTKTFPGLLKYEYIVEKEHESRIRGKNGVYYCLTTKGILASLATGISLEKTYLFKKYINFIENKLEQKAQNIQFEFHLDKNTKKDILNIATQHIKNSILLFLSWHYAYGINLKNKTEMNWYFVDFFKNHDEFVYEEFPHMIDTEQETKYKIILQEYFITFNILSGIKKSIKEKISKKGKLTVPLEFYFENISLFVFEWYRYFDRLQMFSPVNKPYNITSIQSFVINNPNPGIKIGQRDYSGESIQNRIKTEMMKILKADIHLEQEDTIETTIHRYKESNK